MISNRVFRTFPSRVLVAILLVALPGRGASARGPATATATVPQCTRVSFTASYLAQVSPGAGPGFLLVVTNDMDAAIKFAKPFPSSVHWFAQAGSGPWLWRASSGSGGSLVDALRERGPLVAYPVPATTGPREYLAIGPHQHLEWTESMRNNATLRYRPGCQRCKNPGDMRYRAVLAYAYLPGPDEQGLLPCGLRSGPVVMPPLD